MLVLSAQYLGAQNYENICTPGTTFYRNPGNGFMAFRRDSVIPAGNNDTIFISYRAIRDTTGWADCMDTTNGSVLGRKIVKNHSGWFYFFNEPGDTVKINSQASLNQSWKFCMLPGNAYIEARVTSVVPDSVLGLTDQVKVITFQAKDAANNNIAHNLNQKSIRLSQHYGLSKMLDVYSIPNDTNFLTLAGKTIPPLGIQDLTWQDIYNFEVGDVFNYVASAPTQGWATITKVLSKTSYGNDSVVYTEEICQVYHYATYPWYSTSHDTITEKDIFTINPTNSWISYPPGIFACRGYIAAHSYAFCINSSQNRRQKSVTFDAYVFTGGWYGDTCWRYSNGSIYPRSTGVYTEGLGKVETYWYDNTGNWPQQMEEDLVYYKKGSETWGTPVATDCFMLVGISPAAVQNGITIRIIPNPVETKAELQINNAAKNDNYYFILRDILGRVVLQRSLDSNPYLLTRDGLPEGLYFLSVYNKNGILQAQAKLIFK